MPDIMKIFNMKSLGAKKTINTLSQKKSNLTHKKILNLQEDVAIVSLIFLLYFLKGNEYEKEICFYSCFNVEICLIYGAYT